MRPFVVYPYTEAHPIVQRELAAYQPVEVAMARDEYAYCNLLNHLWKSRKDVIIVEHDVLPWPGAIDELWNCPCEWGAYTYRMHGGTGIYHGLGCTKLTVELMDKLPNVWDEPGEWNTLDQRLFFAARAIGIDPHQHRPPVIHLSEKHYG